MLQMTFAQVVEHCKLLEDRKNEIIRMLIKYNVNDDITKGFVKELKDIDAKLEEINDALVDATFMTKKNG